MQEYYTINNKQGSGLDDNQVQMELSSRNLRGHVGVTVVGAVTQN